MGILTSLAVQSAKPGRHGDGEGLYLLVKPSGGRSWVLRIQINKRRRDIGLGSAKMVTLREARSKAAMLRLSAFSGKDPVHQRDRDRQVIPTFKLAALAAHEELKSGWSEKHAAAFLSSLQDHAFGWLGDHRVDTLESSHIRDMLAPIWTTRPAMARKVRQWVATVLYFAQSKGWRTSEIPTKTITMGLPRQAAGRNFAAMPFSEVPVFFRETREKPGTPGRSALLFLILTAARSGEVRSARWKDIDFERKEWNRPANLMKNRLAHTVTLSDPAIELLKSMKGTSEPNGESVIFAAASGKALSDMTLTKVLKTAKCAFTVHGFRSAFRDWAAERMPEVPDSVAEAALAHVVPDQVVRAYKRTTFIEMRRTLLEAWGHYLLA